MTAKPVDTSKFVASLKYQGAIMGASCVYYYQPLWGEAKIILLWHPEDGYAIAGGLFNPGESDPKEVVIRETGEELQHETGKPAITGINSERMEKITEGVSQSRNPDWNPAHYFIYQYQLSMWQYYFQFGPLQTYTEATHLENTKGEVARVFSMAAKEVLAKMDDKDAPMQFAYYHTARQVRQVAERLSGCVPREDYVPATVSQGQVARL